MCRTQGYFSQSILFVLPIKPELVECTVQRKAPFSWRQSGYPFENGQRRTSKSKTSGYLLNCPSEPQMFLLRRNAFFPSSLIPEYWQHRSRIISKQGCGISACSCASAFSPTLSTSVKTRLNDLDLILSHTLECQLKSVPFTYFTTFPRNIFQPNFQFICTFMHGVEPCSWCSGAVFIFYGTHTSGPAPKCKP